ncbi:spore germination protein [Clostridium sp. 2-1]|uniref:spore germination protein n=1 Tax=Clostridium TaxID=1485 RepID=UPI000CDA0208|nr:MULTISPECIES: spore germination protein [Clostridium]MBN7573998.1 spore germination protein [Clostridium beijerinckii]MBN7577678.1 spore germination protein [Clostridium beijerinckii]MBN7583748.1 spore germination protein [Clostridium beijerinckii]MBO0519831.1 spore germination protein [Clostridium beijerinckii]POO92837.1 spore germination protein [Clostridium sp. 2-1]
MNVANNYQANIDLIHSNLVVDKSFDIVERNFIVGGRSSVLYFLNGFIKDAIMEEILKSFFKITPETMNSYKTIDDFINNKVSHVSVKTETDLDKILIALLSGQTIMYVDGYDSFILLDLRTYPGSDSSKPEKEKTLRGGRDGFIEKLVFNAGFIRRRIRDPRLVFDIHQVGNVSKTDVCIAYIDGVADKKVLDLIIDSISKVDIKALTLSDQSLVDVMCTKNWLNPFPKVRFTERPDVAAAHIVEGKIIIIVDNSPNVIILPTGIFDFLQDINDYYFPLFTGNYLRIVRNFVMLATIFLTPVYLMIVNGNIFIPSYFDFLKPQEEFALPLLGQFMLLEFAVDILKLAGLNTPSPLGSAMSLIGGLILGDYAVKTGWFIPQSILYMSIVTIGDFTQPSIEMNFALKFARMILLILCGFFGFWGFIGGIIFILIVMASTKTIAGDKYFYPLIPFNWKALKNLLFRTRISNDVQ